MIYLVFLALLFAIEWMYFKIASHFNIIDRPNHRSSHTEITIRGGGIVFPISVLIWFIYSGFHYPLFVSGLILISIISFTDDVKDTSRRLRLFLHFLAMALVLWQLNLFSYNWALVIAIFIFFTGAINAYNFMDGINGITGIYSLVTLLTLLWINQYQASFVDAGLIISGILGVIVFNFFNFRKKAACFAGDIGSISIAFIICFLLIKFMLQTKDIIYVLLLAVYGIDAIYTIVTRLFKKENIFLAHRSHLYQLLVNENSYNHLVVAALYGAVQLIFNFALLNAVAGNNRQTVFIYILLLLIIYIILRFVSKSHKTHKSPAAKK
jgi:UDP-GlcNAc:undecaprenyl-phosphate GlcNAc-1-phosphate transferase